MDPVHALAEHVTRLRAHDVPEAARVAARTFILDTLGVGVAGSCGPKTAELADVLSSAGGGNARVWGTGRRMPAAGAAAVNGTQAHNSEFDCVHEAAVVHAMSVVLPVALAGAERHGTVSGEALLTAVVAGVDIAAALGLACKSGLRFFRPATAGAFGGVAALAKILGLDQIQTRHAFAIVYGQLGGTMQAHTEGSMLLPMQLGFNARNAVVACDLARAGVEGPENILDGAYGYFKLIEDGGDMQRVARTLGQVWRVTELAHKPYPSGRATHGIIDACLALRDRHRPVPDAISSVVATVPPLVRQLVGRPYRRDMTVNYARLSGAYLAARALAFGPVDSDAFTDGACLAEPVASLAQRVRIDVRDDGDPNALTPVTVEITLRDGTRWSEHIATVYGNPARPMSREAHLAKFRRNMQSARSPIDAGKAEQLIEAVDRLEALADVASLVDLVVP